MPSPTRLAFLWHLHQPDYRDPPTGRPVMPWVRMHALRGYRDLLVETAEHAIPWTINLVPSLLDQLQWYAEGGDDEALQWVRCDPEELAPTTWRWLPSGHPAMTRAQPAYARLRARLDSGEALSRGDLLDLQVWSVLAWFGATALRDYPVLRELRAKGAGYTEVDKIALLETQRSVLAEIPLLVRRLGGIQGPSISCSPYYHPILPLLVDASSARRAQPELPDDVAFGYPEDALLQLTTARMRTEQAVGKPVVGLWPSEGSVSPEVVELVGQAGYRWLATDRQILERSGRVALSAEPGCWELGAGVRGWFRDTDLSDRIGFRYAEWSPAAAVADLVGAALRRSQGGVQLVALDGENPWESYPDAGEGFRRELRGALAASSSVRLVALDEASQEPAVGRVHALHTGSWIGGDLRIWAGHPEDRDAWRALAEVRAAVQRATPAVRERAMRHLLAAEGSDWFWWYGEEFETPWGPTFDALYRAHLAAAWTALGLPVPEALSVPIRRPRRPDRLEPRRILPIDAQFPGHLAGWRGAGEVRPRQGSMAAATGVRGLRFGWSPDLALWVRMEIAGEGFVLEPEPQALFSVPGGWVARYDTPSVALSVVGPSGRWPDQALPLRPPEEPRRLWWDV
jgi:alpha-amylase/alpha-mannosidase (GH57 family)